MRLLVVFLFVACGPSPTDTVAPDPKDLPPLPPSLSTSVALLMEHRAELRLTHQQITALRGLEAELTRRNEPVDEQLAQLDERRSRARKNRGANRGNRGGGGMRGGGMRGGSGGMRGGGSGMRSGGSGMRGGGGRGSSQQRPDREEMRARMRARELSLHQQKIENNAAALFSALESLEAQQTERARNILENNGHDAFPSRPAVEPGVDAVE